jgi:membrane associated rhomboid family serine protease
MMLVPIKIETPYIKWPIANMSFIVITVLFYFFYITGGVPGGILESMVLKDWNPAGLFGTLFLHAGFMHLFGNMLFLWVFGNAVNAGIGNVWYPLSYLFLGLCASSSHLIFGGGPAVGASGAVNGIVGMTLMLYPVNKLKCFYSIFIVKFGTFRVKSFWMILLWFCFDIMGIITGGGNVAYWAHIGGFVSGMLVSFLMIKFNLVTTYDRTLVDIITGNTLEEEPSYRSDEPRLAVMPDGSMNNINNEMDIFRNTQEYEIREQLQLNEIIHRDEELAKMNNTPAMEPVEIKEAELKIRLLRAVRKDNLVTCYFVNEADTINDVEIEASGIVSTAEIYPKAVIKNRDTGSIKFTGSDPETNLRLRLYFSDGSGQVLYKDFIFSESEKQIYESI